MLKQIGWTVILLGAGGSIAVAQTGVTTSGGTTNTVPLFTGGATIGNSNITQSGSNVGIGTTSPGAPFAVYVTGSGTTKIFGPNLELNNFSTEYNLLVANGSFNIQNDSDAGAPIRFTIQGGTGNVGIGTTAPASPLHIIGADWKGISLSNGSDPNSLGSIKQDPTGTYVSGKRFFIISDETPTTDGTNGGIMFRTNNTSTQSFSFPRMVIRETGNVGIGTTAPGASLEVNGTVQLTSGSGAKMIFQDGSVQSVAWNGVLSGGDYAESVNVTGDRKAYEPGDVLVVDPTSEGKFLKSSKPYSTTVTGVYSTKPGAVGRRQVSDRSHMTEEVPMAMVGIIPTKVCAEGGPIQPGDLLVTSSTPGCAMKGTDRTQMLGAVIGKSLGHLESGTAVIEVVVTLQ
jgi:hypothetical protein